jgi:hypothetical protein
MTEKGGFNLMIINEDNKDWREVHKININEELSQEELHKIANDLEQFKSDHEYLDKHTDTILKTYTEQWVAVYRGVIVAHNKNFDKFLKELDKMKCGKNHTPIVSSHAKR